MFDKLNNGNTQKQLSVRAHICSDAVTLTNDNLSSVRQISDMVFDSTTPLSIVGKLKCF